VGDSDVMSARTRISHRAADKDAGGDMAKVTALNVSTAEEMNEAIITYTVQGFSLEGQTPDTATLKKSAVKNLFSGSNILILVLLWILCVLPGLLYVAVMLSKGDLTVIIRLDPTAARAALRTSPLEQVQWSEDRKYWWNGTTWIDASQSAPPAASTNEADQPAAPADVGAEVVPPDGGAATPVSADGDSA
jgi:hypothetical protein